MLEELGFDDQYKMNELQIEIFKLHPVLLLMDIGGSIVYRCGQRLQIERKVDYQVKQHFHYFRPYYDDFIKAIVEHPRVKFAVYTSIMRKNLMPLLMHVFNQTKLKHLKN